MDDETNGISQGGERPQAHDEVVRDTTDRQRMSYDPMSHDQGTHDELADDLERQARETMRVIRESAGDLGTRMRRVLDHAATLWDAAAPTDAEAGPGEHAVSADDVIRARALARRWKKIDFLVDADLPAGMTVTALRDGAAWRVEVRERGESRTLSEASEPYRPDVITNPAPVLPLWEYTFATPEIESGERRERLANFAMVGACLRCNGTGHQTCRHCEGKGFVQCPVCHGRARVMCRRCRGRGRVADAQAERRARASKSYLQVHAERLASDAAVRLADLSERLRQEHGVPLPPSSDWLPTAPASGETVPCPDCLDGTVACSCGNGKLVCETCRGSGHSACNSCGGSGRVVRYREIVRRFDTRRSTRILPGEAELTKPLGSEAHRALARATGDEVWRGDVEQLLQPAPTTVPAGVWSAAQELAREHVAKGRQVAPSPGEASVGAANQAAERRVIGQQVRLTRVPLTQVDYTFAGHPFTFLAVGHTGAERFWAEMFPPRWSRVGRFVKALVRDLEDFGADLSAVQRPADVTVLDEYRSRRAHNGSTNGATGIQRVKIVEEQALDSPPDTDPSGENPE